MKRNLDHRNYRRFREKRLQTDEFSEHLQNLQKTRRKVTVWSSKLKIMCTAAKIKKIHWTRGREATPAGCGCTSATSHRKHKLVMVLLADSTDDCAGICMGNDAS